MAKKRVRKTSGINIDNYNGIGVNTINKIVTFKKFNNVIIKNGKTKIVDNKIFEF